MSSFVETPHLTQNLGDGTYFHSGQLAIQAAVDAGVDMTYKVLLNGHVAMTGGQLPPGQVDAGALSGVLLTQGVSRVIITTDDEDRLRDLDIPAKVEVWDRQRLIEAQELLAQVPGVTVLIHDQPCAAELRRARRRGTAETPTRRVMINERVCEGCGDCSEKSSCLSVQPTDTPFGRKTRIDQSSCNLDLACLDGDCPSFMSVHSRPKRWWHRRRRLSGSPPARQVASGATPTGLASPPEHIPGETRIRFAGIGGTGVVTVSQIVGTAAMLDGLDVRGLDQTGLSQKAGPVLSDLYLTAHSSEHSTNHLGDGQADLLVAFDPIVAAAESTLAAADPGRTTLIGSTSATPTASMITDPSGKRDDPLVIRSRVDAACGPNPRWLDAVGAAARLVGEPATANILLTGVAVQAGALPISLGSMLAAIDLNGVAVKTNTAAFEWGRCAVADPEQFEAALARCETEPGAPSTHLPQAIERGVDELGAIGAPDDLVAAVRLRCADLIAFQDSVLAADYLGTMLRFAHAEGAIGQSWNLTESVATQLHRVLAYKDEYEVARLLLDPASLQQARELADGEAKVVWNLHPPMLRSLGLDHKIEIGIGAAPLIRLLARGKRLRGHRFDPFGMAGVRRAERRLIEIYRDALEQLLDTVRADNYDAAVRIASLPETIRGYEGRKLAGIAEFDRTLPTLLDELGDPPGR